MSDREPAQDPTTRPGDPPAPAAEHRAQVDVEGAGDEGAGPYRNLFVPLFVVPAMIVMALVLVFVFFGQIAGEEASIEQNLRRVQEAGANERTQALFHLVQQVEENWGALQAGEELPWPVEGEEVSARLDRVWAQTAPGDSAFRYVLAAALTQMEAPGSVDKLMECLEPVPGSDPEGTIRFNVLIGLGVAGKSLLEEERERVGAAVVEFLDSDDPGLRQAAAAALQNLPGPTTTEALQDLLAAGELELRGQAAVSLARLGDATGAPVLWEMVERSTYDRVREVDERKFRDPALESALRAQAVLALGRLGRNEDRSALQDLADGDEDLEVREAAMQALSGPDPGSE